MKILIIRFSSIGDIVLTTPVIRALKQQITSSEVHFVTKIQYEAVLAGNPHIDKLHLLGESFDQLVDHLKQEKYDFIVDLHNNLRTRLLKYKLNVKSKSFQKLNIEKWLKVNFKIDRLPSKHIVDRYFETVSELGVKPDEEGLEYYIQDLDEFESDWLPEKFRNGFTAVAIGGGFNTKRLPFEKLVELCDRINRPVILLGGKTESEIGERVEKFFERIEGQEETDRQLEENFGKKTIVFNACGKFSLGQSASVIRDADYVFTHDTGMMHIAAAFKKHIFSIWGNTIPEFGMYPYRTSFVIFENKKLNCRPCSKLGHERCPKGHFKCMQDLVFDFYLPE